MENKIYEKLLQVQSELKCAKGQYNSFGNYYYRNLDDILEAAKPILANQKLLLYISDDIKAIGDRYYVEAIATLIDTETGNCIKCSAMAREESSKGMSAGQCTGASSSYARKYCLNGLFCIDDTKDLDSDEYQANSKGKISTADANKLKEEVKAKRLDIKNILNYYHVGKVEDMTKEMYADALKKLI